MTNIIVTILSLPLIAFVIALGLLGLVVETFFPEWVG